ncbi:hypothetical protein KIN20_031954 [Parelaphostrongylus tenuis]|uniref:Uncharacterized protein n=1 Tax=Parelaphostrongylus tenuis TaxID=148309 RepID=A0AAD5WH57_PARTN|nr:hypothetical protein KIN20_031954 [Parelaphostrongylus tenuis]
MKPEFYARGIDLLPEKWQEVLEVEGEYFNYQNWMRQRNSSRKHGGLREAEHVE